jgi:class 3 adenylate cyclase
VHVRVGIHTTEPHLHDEGYVGVGVSRAARICAAAHGGQVVLSSVTAGILQDLDGLGFRLHDIGEHRLKDMAGPERLFQVDADGLSTGFPPLRGAATPGSIGTLLVTDLAGFGRIMREQGDDAAADVAAQYQTIVDQSARASGGYLAERVADHSLCVFVAPEQALAAAAAVRSVLAERGFVVQAAVHTGRLARPAEGVFGSPAIRAMRLCGSCEPGQILVSHATGALLEGAVLDGLALRDLGERALPGTDEPPSRVYELVVT